MYSSYIILLLKERSSLVVVVSVRAKIPKLIFEQNRNDALRARRCFSVLYVVQAWMLHCQRLQCQLDKVWIPALCRIRRRPMSRVADAFQGCPPVRCTTSRAIKLLRGRFGIRRPLRKRYLARFAFLPPRACRGIVGNRRHVPLKQTCFVGFGFD